MQGTCAGHQVGEPEGGAVDGQRIGIALAEGGFTVRPVRDRPTPQLHDAVNQPAGLVVRHGNNLPPPSTPRSWSCGWQESGEARIRPTTTPRPPGGSRPL